MEQPPTIHLNAPCPCGSGRTYRRCCLARDRRTRAIASQSTQKAGPELFKWAAATFPEEFQACKEAYFGYAEECFPASKLALFLDRTREMVATNFADVFVHDWEVRGNLTPCDLYLLGRGASLHPRAYAYLAAARKAALALVEVEGIDPGKSIVFHDLLSRRRVRVVEHTMSREVARWQVMFVRIAEMAEENLLTGAIYSLQRDHLEWVLDTLRREKDQYGTRSLSWPAFFHTRWNIVPAIWFDLYVDPLARLQLTTTDGEPLRWVKLDVALKEASSTEVASRLDAVEELNRDGDTTWHWVQAREGRDDIIIATLKNVPGGLEITVASLEREKRVRALIEHTLKGLIVGVLREETDVIETMRQQQSEVEQEFDEEESGENTIPPEIAADLEREFRRRYLQTWIDLPVPALDNLTPRQAASTPTMRQRLISLLKTIELGEQRAGSADSPGEVSRLWHELGIRRP